MAYRNDYFRNRYSYSDYDPDYDWDDDPYYYQRYNRSNNQDWSQGRNYGYQQNQRFNRRFNQRNPGFNQRNPDINYFDYNDTPDWDTNPTWTYYEYWFVPGPYEGFGPQDYQRSDERIRDDIHERLTRHGRLDARNIHVDVHDAIVTLTGSVNSRREKRLAEDLADDVSGVEDVNNRLKINRQQGQAAQQKNIQTDKIHTGMEVVDSNGKHAGTVKEIRSNDFLLDRDMDRDVFVPFGACQKIQGDKIFLNVTADQIDKQGWQEPAIISTSSSRH